MDKSVSKSWESDPSYASLRDYLELDSQPIFVNHLYPRAEACLVFTNEAFNHERKELRELRSCLGLTSDATPLTPDVRKFLAWSKNVHGTSSVNCAGHKWTAVTLHTKWRIIRGEPIREHRLATTGGQQTDLKPDQLVHKDVSLLRAPKQTTIDLCGILHISDKTLQRHCQLVQDFDWSSTLLGPIYQWSPTVLQTVMFVLSHPSPCNSFWGPDRIMLYNQPYTNVIRSLHPSAMGRSAKTEFEQFWEQFEVVFQRVETTKRAIEQSVYTALVDRDSGVEELSFSAFMLPIFNPNGDVQGVLNCATDITEQVVSARRMATLSSLHDASSGVSTLQDLWLAITTSLQQCVRELPFAVLLCIDEENLISNVLEDSNTKDVQTQKWYVQGSLGFPTDHPAISSPLDWTDESGWGPTLRLLSNATGSLHITKDNVAINDDLFTGGLDRAVGTEYSEMVLCPLFLPAGRNIGCLMLGINPFYRYDNKYEQFLGLLARKINDVATSILLSQRERRRLEEEVMQAEQQRLWLLEQLEQQRKEARESESRFYNFADQAPVGVFIVGSEGEIKYANDTFHGFHKTSAGDKGTMLWRPSVYPDDLQSLDAEWQSLLNGQIQRRFEYRTVRKPRMDGPEKEEILYLCSTAFPELGEDGTMKSITGVVMDVSVHKAHEQAVANDLANALEAKRAQEYFMDMVSHEMRNPLNAMLQCSEEALQMLQSVQRDNNFDKSQLANLATIVEAVETIDWCGRHQRQIIDDVLTVSKLDSNLLTLSKTASRPAQTVRDIVRIFGSDIRASDIRLAVQIASPRAEQACMMDSGRVLQVLINLVGNAIKFLKNRPIRELALSMEVLDVKPELQGVPFARPVRPQPRTTRSMGAADNKIIYVQFSVQDTGPGLTTDKIDTLFARFKQASPKTHVQYGGSGLGLFISRELIEMHGGEIGLTSQVDEGSTFAFYITAYAIDENGAGVQNPTPTNSSMMTNTEAHLSATNTSAMAGNALNRGSNPNTTTGKISILVVEDNLINQKVLVRQLTKLGFDVLTANHGQEALAILERSSWLHRQTNGALAISVVLCDLEMPVMDGITCIQHIREWQRRKHLIGHVPTVAVTGNARAEQVEGAKEAGFDEVVCKPFSVSDIVSVIYRLVNSQHDSDGANG